MAIEYNHPFNHTENSFIGNTGRDDWEKNWENQKNKFSDFNTQFNIKSAELNRRANNSSCIYCKFLSIRLLIWGLNNLG